jgi:hypothetical protein
MKGDRDYVPRDPSQYNDWPTPEERSEQFKEDFPVLDAAVHIVP